MRFEIELKNLIYSQYKSINSFAKALNIPYSTINNIFQRGIGGVSVQVALKICMALNIDMEQIPADKLVLKDNACNNSGVLLYSKLDERDKAEIRGEMKHMLKADKYKKKPNGIKSVSQQFLESDTAQIAAYGQGTHTIDE